MPDEPIPFDRPFRSDREQEYVLAAIASGRLQGGGPFARRCEQWIEARTGVIRALLVNSGTGALEMGVLLAGIAPGDEVLLPSFTFPSIANAVVLRGAIPVFVDIRPDTFNIDESLVRAAITPRTRAIAVMHYAGIACAMDTINAIAAEHGLFVLEDAAQGIGASYHGRPLGTLGSAGMWSFHETKNVVAGEGGTLLTNDAALAARAEILRDKGTNRTQFLRGEIDRYTWVDVGSSWHPPEIAAAFLLAQLERADDITTARRCSWQRYHDALASLEADGALRRPVVPPECEHNGHAYVVLLPTPADRDRVLRALHARNIRATFHYIPLHSAPAGRRFGRQATDMRQTDAIAGCLLRLPLFAGVDTDRVVAALTAVTHDMQRA